MEGEPGGCQRDGAGQLLELLALHRSANRLPRDEIPLRAGLLIKQIAIMQLERQFTLVEMTVKNHGRSAHCIKCDDHRLLAEAIVDGAPLA